jgi:ankyrin repeat protein
LLGIPPLSYAVYGCGSTSVVRFLLDHGAKPNKTNRNGVTALHYAATEGSILPLRMFVLFLSPVALFILPEPFCFISNPKLVMMYVLQ